MTNEAKIPDEAYAQSVSKINAEIALTFSVPPMQMIKSAPVLLSAIAPNETMQSARALGCIAELNHLPSEILKMDQYMRVNFMWIWTEKSMGYRPKVNKVQRNSWTYAGYDPYENQVLIPSAALSLEAIKYTNDQAFNFLFAKEEWSECIRLLSDRGGYARFGKFTEQLAEACREKIAEVSVKEHLDIAQEALQEKANSYVPIQMNPKPEPVNPVVEYFDDVSYGCRLVWDRYIEMLVGIGILFAQHRKFPATLGFIATALPIILYILLG